MSNLNNPYNTGSINSASSYGNYSNSNTINLNPTYDYNDLVIKGSGNYITTASTSSAWTISDAYVATTIKEIIRTLNLKEFTIRALLTDGAFDSNIDDIIYTVLTSYTLSEKFINDYYNVIATKNNCSVLLKTQTLNEKFIEKHFNDFKKYKSLSALCSNQNLCIPFIERHYSDFKISDICDMLYNSHIKLTLTFILSHKELLSNINFLNCLGTSPDYSEIFNKIIRMIDKYEIGFDLDWKKISWATDLDEDIIEEYIDKIDFHP